MPLVGRVSERTAKFHVSNILTKLQLDDRRSLYQDSARNQYSHP